MTSKRWAGLACTAALGLASGAGISACGEDRGGVEVEGGGTTATGSTATGSTTTSPSTTPTTTTTAP